MGAGSEMNGHCFLSSLSSMAFWKDRERRTVWLAAYLLRFSSTKYQSFASVPPWHLWWWGSIETGRTWSRYAPSSLAEFSPHYGPDDDSKQDNKMYLQITDHVQNTLQWKCQQVAIKIYQKSRNNAFILVTGLSGNGSTGTENWWEVIEKFTPEMMLQPRFCTLLMMLLLAWMFACWMSLARFSSPMPAQKHRTKQ